MILSGRSRAIFGRPLGFRGLRAAGRAQLDKQQAPAYTHQHCHASPFRLAVLQL
jgi:hypothetical protein